MKTCYICKQSFPLSNFTVYPKSGYGLNFCKSCESKKGAAYRLKNKDKLALADNQYKNSEKGYVNETIVGIFTRARKNNFRKKWIPICTKPEIYDELMLYIQDHGRNCEYCKQPWTYIRAMGSRGSGPTKRSPNVDSNFSVDRLDSTKTYERSNLVFCCTGCNNRKNQVRLSDIINIVRVWMKRKTQNEMD